MLSISRSVAQTSFRHDPRGVDLEQLGEVLAQQARVFVRSSTSKRSVGRVRRAACRARQRAVSSHAAARHGARRPPCLSEAPGDLPPARFYSIPSSHEGPRRLRVAGVSPARLASARSSTFSSSRKHLQQVRVEGPRRQRRRLHAETAPDRYPRRHWNERSHPAIRNAIPGHVLRPASWGRNG